MAILGQHSFSETSASDENATEQQRFWTKGLSPATSNAVPRFLGRETCKGARPRGGRGNAAAGWEGGAGRVSENTQVGPIPFR